MPFMTDLPAVFDSELVENRDGPGPYGAKGMGESGIVSIAPAIANAIVDAIGVQNPGTAVDSRARLARPERCETRTVKKFVAVRCTRESF